MPAKLTSTINKIPTVPNPINAEIIDQYYHYMKGSDISENHQNNCLKLCLHLQILGDGTTFYNIKKKEQITAFLDTTVKRLVGEDDSCHGFITPLPTILPSFSICRAFPARYGIHLRIEP